MLKSYSIAEARNHFTEIVRDVEQAAAIQLTRRGKPVAFVLSAHEYERLRKGKVDFWEAYLAFRQRYQLAGLDLDPDTIFADVRDEITGTGYKLGMIRYLLDTNIINEPIKTAPNTNVLLRLDQHRTAVALASITWHELWFGCKRLPPSHKRTVVEAYLTELLAASILILSYDQHAADWHASERSRLVTLGRTPPFADGQIAAVAAVNGLVLVTRNVADFTSFQGLTLENWFQP